MRRLLLTIGITATIAAILLLRFHRPPPERDVAVVQPQTAKTTVLSVGKLVDRTHVQLFLRESLADTVKEGQAVVVSGAGLRKSGYAGTVTAVADEATVQNGKTGLLAEVTLEETALDESLKPGLTATARITVKTFANVIVANDSWFLPDESSPTVLVLENGKATFRQLTILQRTDNGVLVEGLLANEKVIVKPEGICNHQKVKEKPTI